MDEERVRTMYDDRSLFMPIADTLLSEAHEEGASLGISLPPDCQCSFCKTRRELNDA